MKKFLSFLAVLALSTSAFAQSAFMKADFKKAEDVFSQKNPSVVHAQQPASHRASLAEGQLIMGGYTSDVYATPDYGLGLTSFPGTLRIAAELPLEDFQMFNGGKVVKIRVALANSSSVSRVFITPVNNEGYVVDDIVSQNVSFNSAGWNEVELTTPVDLDFSGYSEFLLGFDYRQISGTSYSAYPLSLVNEGEKTYETLVYGNLGSGMGWYYLGATSYGNLSVQAVVEVDLPEQKVSASSVSIGQYVHVSDAAVTETANLKVANLGQQTINSVGFSYYIDEAKIGDEVVNTTITSGNTEVVPFNVAIPAGLAAGNHTLKVELTTINGAAPAEVVNSAVETNFLAYINTVARQKYLIEHFTSWTCTYCYLGYNILRKMESTYDDVAWVAFHGNLSSPNDPYYFPEVYDAMGFLGSTGYPSAAFDRDYLPELAEGNELAYGLGYNASYATQMANAIYGLMKDYAAPSFVTLGIDTNFDADTRELEITVNGTGVEGAAQLLAGQLLTIYLTEEGLVGRQYSNGSWQNGFEHNNTLRAILTSTQGDEITWDGDNFTFTKTFAVPADYVAENLSVVAFVAPQPSNDTKSMAVNNCEKVAVNVVSDDPSVDPDPGTDPEDPSTGIQNVGADQQEVVRYNTNGQVINAPQKGLNIIKRANGKTSKVMVK